MAESDASSMSSVLLVNRSGVEDAEGKTEGSARGRRKQTRRGAVKLVRCPECVANEWVACLNRRRGFAHVTAVDDGESMFVGALPSPPQICADLALSPLLVKRVDDRNAVSGKSSLGRRQCFGELEAGMQQR